MHKNCMKLTETAAFYYSSFCSVTIHGLADKENPAVIDSGVFAWLIEVPVYF